MPVRPRFTAYWTIIHVTWLANKNKPSSSNPLIKKINSLELFKFSNLLLLQKQPLSRLKFEFFYGDCKFAVEKYIPCWETNLAVLLSTNKFKKTHFLLYRGKKQCKIKTDFSSLLLRAEKFAGWQANILLFFPFLLLEFIIPDRG